MLTPAGIAFTVALSALAMPVLAESPTESPGQRVGPSLPNASALPSVGEPSRTDLIVISQLESGHRNIPNFMYVPHRFSAGGYYQITDSLFSEFKDKVIGASKYPNAMAMPEDLQGQMAGWIVAEKGFMPWTCCNTKLRQALAHTSPQKGDPQTERKVGMQEAVVRGWGNPFAAPIPTSRELVFDIARK